MNSTQKTLSCEDIFSCYLPPPTVASVHGLTLQLSTAPHMAGSSLRPVDWSQNFRSSQHSISWGYRQISHPYSAHMHSVLPPVTLTISLTDRLTECVWGQKLIGWLPCFLPYLSWTLQSIPWESSFLTLPWCLADQTGVAPWLSMGIVFHLHHTACPFGSKYNWIKHWLYIWSVWSTALHDYMNDCCTGGRVLAH